MMVSTSASTSPTGRPRAPWSSAAPLVDSTMARACSFVNGGTRNATSWNTSVNTPPSPNRMVGPNGCWCDSPRITSATASVTIGCTTTPAIDAPGAAAAARSVSSRYVARTAASGVDADRDEAEIGLVGDLG